MAHKFLISDGKFLMSASVEFHRDLLPQGKSIKDCKVAGGGWWHLDKNEMKCYLYSSSEDFKAASKDDIINALNNSYISRYLLGFRFYISRADSIDGAKREAEILGEADWIYEKKETQLNDSNS